MSGPGRPTEEDVERRRKRLLVLMVISAKASPEAIKRLAEKIGTTDHTVKNDLIALNAELEAVAEDELPESLLRAIGGADTFRLLQDLTQKLMVEMASGKLDRELGETLLGAITVQRHMIKANKEEQPLEAVRALELLTPQELELLDQHRRKLAGPPVAPGAAVPPPGASPTTSGSEPTGAEGSKP
jgi:hypothetical protein